MYGKPSVEHLHYTRDKLLSITSSRISRATRKRLFALNIWLPFSLHPETRQQTIAHGLPIQTVIGRRPSKSPLSRQRSNIGTILHVDTNFVKSIKAKKIKACVFNVQSIKNKAIAVNEYIVDKECDIAILVETWLRPGSLDQTVVADLCPPGYKFVHLPRENASGYGGLGVLYRENLCLKADLSYPGETRTFEMLNVVLVSNQVNVNFAIVYRPPPSKRNGFSTADFFSQFTNLIDSLAVQGGNVVILGDLNFHLDDLDNRQARHLNDLIFSARFIQHVTEPTHRNGHTLDVLISRESDSIVQNVYVHNPLISDHSAIHFELDLQPPSPATSELVFRKYGDIEKSKWKADVGLAFIDEARNSSLEDLL